MLPMVATLETMGRKRCSQGGISASPKVCRCKDGDRGGEG